MAASKKPTIKRFREVAKECGGIKSRMAEKLNVFRLTIDEWCAKDPEFAAVIHEYKMKLVDECQQTGRALAMGIPEIDPVTRKVIGWKEKPDAGMLKFFLATIGKKEGFGESVDVTSNGKDVLQNLSIEIIDKREQIERPSDDE